MITYLKGDIFSSPAQVLINTVNTVGVMGKGVALEFKKRYPEMFSAYERVCKAKQLEIGKLFLWKGPEKWVLMFPTKVHWRNRISAVGLWKRRFGLEAGTTPDGAVSEKSANSHLHLRGELSGSDSGAY